MHQFLARGLERLLEHHIVEIKVMSNEIKGPFDVVVLDSGARGTLGPGMVFGFLTGRHAVARLRQF